MTFPNELETNRLRLRRVTVDDAQAVFDYASDAETAKYMTFPVAKTVEDVVPFLTSIQTAMDNDTEFHWAIEHIDTDTVIGVITARRLHGIELGYCLNHDHWGNGYMAEAATAIIDWAQTAEDLQRIWATCDVDNDKSAALLRKVGMEEEGVLRKWAVHPNISATPRDCRVFAL
jgi:ribosomal-protein-alanine N-acetyltransferase